jgi:hypothetical protein
MASSRHDHEFYLTFSGRPDTDIPTFVSRLCKIRCPSTQYKGCQNAEGTPRTSLIFMKTTKLSWSPSNFLELQERSRNFLQCDGGIIRVTGDGGIIRVFKRTDVLTNTLTDR